MSIARREGGAAVALTGFSRWLVQDEVRDKRERLRGAQADFDRISELHSERRQAAAAAADATQQERLRSFLVRP